MILFFGIAVYRYGVLCAVEDMRPSRPLVSLPQVSTFVVRAPFRGIT